MSDTNVHRVVGNLLVGTSHFFVDTTTNQVGINTSSPSASLDVATGDVKVGSGITLANNGTITATGGFSGNGSGLTGVNSDSGSWVNGSSSNIHLAVSTDNVGIGMDNPSYKLDVDGDINISSTSTLRVGGTPAVFSNWSVDGSDIYRSSGRVGIGTTPSSKLHIYDTTTEPIIALQHLSDGENNSSTNILGNLALHYSPRSGGYPSVGIRSIRRANTWDDQADMEFYVRNGGNGEQTAMVINSASTVNGARVGIGTTSPQTNLHIESSASTGVDIYGGDTSNPYIFIGEHQSTYSSKWGGKLTYYGDSNVRWLNISVVDANVETAAITVRRNGHVGVGTESPDTALHVNGVIKQTGANWSLTNGGVAYASNDGTQAGTYAYLNRSLGSRNNVTLTHEYQNQKYTRSRVTVNQTGKYAMYVNGFKHVNTNSNAYSLQLHKNANYVNVRAYTGPSDPSSSYQNIGSTYTLMDLNANDYVEVYIANGTMHGNDSIYFAGHLVA